MSRPIILLAGALLFYCSCANNATPTAITHRDGEPDVYTYATSDKKMTEAKAQAMKTFHLFYKAIKNDTRLMQSAAVKLGFYYNGPEEGSKEHMWLTRLNFQNDSLFGIVSNEPLHTKEVKLDQKIFVDITRLSDWYYVENGRLVGGYTLRVQYNQMHDSDRKKVKEALGCKIE